MKNTYVVFIIGILGIIVGAGLVGGFVQTTDYIGDRDDVTDSNVKNVDITKSTYDPSGVSEVNSNKTVYDSTVTIFVETGNELSSQGSGFMYTDKHIMTNEHVIDSNNEDLYIKYDNGDWSEATTVGMDKHTDIAVLRPEKVPDYADPIPVQTELPERGTRVIAVGSPNGLENSVTTGVVSGIERSVKIQTEFSVPDSIQTDAALNPGNSGGPLVDAETGALVGINRATEGENIGFAVSSRMADKVGQSIIETGDHQHPLIGIVTVELNPLTDNYGFRDKVGDGLIVTNTLNGTSGAEKLRSASDSDIPDVITKVEGEEIKDNEDIASYVLLNHQPGDKITMEIYRDQEYQNVTIELESRD